MNELSNKQLLVNAQFLKYNSCDGGGFMETKDVLKENRKESKLSQSQFAERINVTRQAVSRWKNGLTTHLIIQR